MIVSLGELLTYMGIASTISDADRALLNMLHKMSEQAIKGHERIQNDLEYAQHTEYLPIGDTGQSRGEVTLDDYGMANGRVVAEARYGRMDRLQLRHTPVVDDDNLAVYEDTDAYAGQGSDAFAAATLLTKGTDYFLDVDDPDNGISRTGHLVRCSGTWSQEPRSIKVVYYGGFTAAQFDAGIATPIKEAVILTVVKAYYQAKTNQQSQGAGPIKSESIGKYAATYGSSVADANSGMVITIPPEALEKLEPFMNLGRYLA